MLDKKEHFLLDLPVRFDVSKDVFDIARHLYAASQVHFYFVSLPASPSLCLSLFLLIHNRRLATVFYD